MANKYHAKAVLIDNIRFDSQAEASRYLQLRMLERAGQLVSLRVHPRYELCPAFVRDGKSYRAVCYVADFAYEELVNGLRCKVIEDVKGVRTQAFSIKERLFRYQHPELDFRVLFV